MRGTAGIVAAVTVAGLALRAVPFPSTTALQPFAYHTAHGALQDAPAVTLLYQNFPNPFPGVASAATCIWFDLHQSSSVDLSIFDVRGNLVRRLIPSAAINGELGPGRYGRAGAGSNPPCDARFAWDGRSDAGEFVPIGVYLIRLRTRIYSGTKKALFRGR